MGIVDRTIPKITYHGGTLQTETPQPYIDDIFDPLFNAEVRKYLQETYGGNPFSNTLGGYAELTHNALFGNKKWGILGPGMGIWSAFGRSMDKADDVILGTLTEGVRGITGQGMRNPLTEIMVEDKDYTGKKLLASMANSMRGLAGGTTLNENDLGGTWNLAGLGIDLATDPGIMGGAIMREGQYNVAHELGTQKGNKALQDIGKLMSDYDNIMANVAGNTVVPGMHFATSKLIHKILDVVQHRSAAKYVPVDFEGAEKAAPDVDGSAFTDTAPSTPPSPPPTSAADDPVSNQLMDMLTELYAVRKAQPHQIQPSPLFKAGSLEDALSAIADQDAVDYKVYKQLIDARDMANAKARRLNAEAKAAAETYVDPTELDKALQLELSKEQEARALAEQEFSKYLQQALIDAGESPDINIDPSRASQQLTLQDLADDLVGENKYADVRKALYNDIYDIASSESYPKLRAVGKGPEVDIHPDPKRIDMDTPFPDDKQHFRKPIKMGPKYWDGERWKYGRILTPGKTYQEMFDEMVERPRGVGNAIRWKQKLIADSIVVPSKTSTGASTFRIRDISQGKKRFNANAALKAEFETRCVNQGIPAALKWKQDQIRKLSPLTTHEFVQDELYKAIDSEYNPTYVDDLFSVPPTPKVVAAPTKENPLAIKFEYPDGNAPKYLWDYSPDEAPELYDAYLSRLANADFENEAVYNQLLTQLGMDPKSRNLHFVENKAVPYFQTTRYAHSPEVQQAALNTAASSVSDLNKTFGPYKDENWATYTDRMLNDAALKLVLPNTLAREDFVRSMVRLNQLNPSDKMQALQYVSEVEHLADLLQRNAPALPDFEQALQYGLEQLSEFETEMSASDYVKQFIKKLTDPKTIVLHSGNPLIDKYRKELHSWFLGDTENLTKIVSPEVQLEFLQALHEVEKEVEALAPQYAARANRVLMHGDDVFDNSTNVVDTFIQRVNDNLYQPMHNTQLSLTDAWHANDKMLSNEEGAHGLASAINTTRKSSELGYDTVGFYNEVLRRHPEIVARKDFSAQARKLANYYQFHLGTEQAIPEWLDMPALRKEFSSEVAPLAQKVMDAGYSPFQKKLAPSGTPQRKLQRILGYEGKVPERSANWRELRMLLGEQTTGGYVHGKFKGTITPVDTDAKWHNPQAVLEFQRKAYENRVNKKFDTLSVSDLSVTPKARATVEEFLSSNTGKKLYPGYSSRNAAKKFSAEANATELLAEKAVQTQSDPKKFADELYNPVSEAEQINKDFHDSVESMIESSGGGRHTPKSFRNTDELVANAYLERKKNANGDYATMRSEATEHLVRKIREVVTGATAEGLDINDVFHKYARAKQAEVGDVFVGKTALEDLVNARGIRIAAFRPDDPMLKSAQQYFGNVTSTINNQLDGLPFIRVLSYKLRNGNVVTGIMLNTDLKSTPKQLSAVYKKIAKVNTNALPDFTLSTPGRMLHTDLRKTATWTRLDDLLGDLHETEKSYHRYLGLEYTDTPHVKNVMVADPSVGASYAQSIYGNLDYDSAADFADQLYNLDRFSSTRGSFNSKIVEKRLMGDISNFEYKDKPLFTTDLYEQIQGTLAGGAYDNVQFQNFVGFFVNHNFNIHSYTNSPEGLKKIFYPDGSSATGNLHNFTLAAPKFDETGRVIGFKRFDKMSDAGFEAAFKDPNTVLLPEYAFGPIDSILKRQKRMSNKAYRWINSHVTVPYKFGVLMNPGFLLGNMSDAYLKQATTMAQKYSTSMSEELVNVYSSIGDVMRLNNSFNDAYEKFVQACDTVGVKLAPSERVPSLVMGNKRARQILKQVADGVAGEDLIAAANFTEEEVGIIRAWMFLNNSQNSSAFARNLRDAEDIASAINKSPYQAPTNLWDRVLKGRGQYDPNDINTWGLLLNNPAAVKMMDTSEDIEKLFRSAAILNDLRHQGTPMDYIAEILANPKLRTDPKTMEKLYVGMQEAVDAMANSNFDYESTSEFMNAAATVIPFPTFFLKNIAYWLQMFVENPQYIDNAISVQQGLWEGKDDENDEFQAEAKGRGAIPVEAPGAAKGTQLDKFFKGIYKPTPLNSLFGALSAVNDPFGDVLFRVHPAIATGAVTASHASPLKEKVEPYMTANRVQYRPYSTNQYQKNVKFSDPEFNPLAYTAHRFNPLERTVNTYLRTPGKLKSNSAQLSDFLPSVFQPDFSKKQKK